jgi:hypothetical protein
LPLARSSSWLILIVELNMSRKPITIALLTVLPVAAAWAVKGTPFVNIDVYMRRAKQIVIAECSTVGKSDLHGLDTYEVEVVRVLTGPATPGGLQVVTTFPMTRGVRYMLYSMAEPDFQAIPELSVVALPADFNLARLGAKSLREQLLLIFQARLSELRKHPEDAGDEQKSLEKALGKADKP